MKQKKKLINLYVDGELGTEEAHKVEKMIEADSDMQQYFENIVRLNGMLNSAYDLPNNQSNVDHITQSIVKKKSGFLTIISDINWVQTTAMAASAAAVMLVNNYMFTPNGIDLSVIERHVAMTRNHALENKLSNESATWKDDLNQFSVVITPIKTYKSSNGAFCREYKEVVNHNGEITSEEGLACRENKDDWLKRSITNDLYNQG